MRMKYYALWLSLVCIAVFALQMIIPGFTDTFVLDSGKMAEVWRFVSAIFLHGSFAHILANLFALALFGTILEGFVGSKKLLIVFFASGIFANLVAVWFYPSSLGASGAIYGILGALIVIRPMMMVWVYGMPMPMLVAGMLWVAGGFFGLFYPSSTGHIAHLSGMGLGLIFGAIWRDWRHREAEKQRVVIDEKSMRDWEDRHIRA